MHRPKQDTWGLAQHGFHTLQVYGAVANTIGTTAFAGLFLYFIAISGMAASSTLTSVQHGLESAAVGATYVGIGSLLWFTISTLAPLVSPITTIAHSILGAHAFPVSPGIAALAPAPPCVDYKFLSAGLCAVAFVLGCACKPAAIP